MEDEIGYLSHSSANSHCHKAVYWRKIQRIQSTVGPEACWGFGWEAACISILRADGEDPHRLAEETATRHGVENKLDADAWSKFFDQRPAVMNCIENYPSFCSDLEYIAEQTQISLQILGVARPVTGFIDIEVKRHGHLTLVDCKRKSRKIQHVSVEYQRQAALYALAIMHSDGLKSPPPFELHVATCGSKPFVSIIPVEITRGAASGAIQSLKDYNYRIDNNHWPRNMSSFLCSPKWCSFYSMCMEALKEEEQDALSTLWPDSTNW